jgi:mevalonate pyrophosphate decarboxylase
VPAMVAQGDFFFLSGSGKRAVLGGFVSWCGGKRVLGQSGRENFSTGLQIFFADPR